MANELKKALNSARIRVAGKHVNENSASLDASRLIAGAFAESAPSSGYSSLSSSFVFEGQASTAATGMDFPRYTSDLRLIPLFYIDQAEPRFLRL